MSDLHLHNKGAAYWKLDETPLARALERVADWQSKRRDARMARQTLKKLSARHLKDIGLIDSDIDACIRSASFVQGSQDLATRARIRAGNW